VLDLQRQAGNRAVTGLVQRFGLGEAVDAVAGAGGEVATILSAGAAMLLAKDREAALLGSLVRGGFRDRDKLANVVFWLRHPDRLGTRIRKGEADLSAEWLEIRRTKVDAALRQEPAAPAGGSTPAPAGRPAKPMTDAERQRLIEAARKQGSSGSGAIREQMEASLPDNGDRRMTLDEWFADHVPDATFLGMRIRESGGPSPGVHRIMLGRLRLAEDALRGQFPGADDAAIRARLGLRTISGLRPPKLATGGKRPSLHCFGMAIDVNRDTNPFVGLKKVSKEVTDPATRAEIAVNRSPRVVERAMLLLHGEHFDVERTLKVGKRKATAEQAYDLHARASRALADYLQLTNATDADLLPLVARAQAAGDPHDLAWWRARLAEDWKQTRIKAWDFEHHPDVEKRGYMDLARELVLALTGPGGLNWGGNYNTAKDMMHFDYFDGPIKRPD
jgi:hypothetical protein